MNRHISRFIFISTVLAAGLFTTTCTEEPLVEEEVVLEISWEDTSVIPNQGLVTITPEVTSGAPSAFSISEVFFGETAYQGSEFSIDPESGVVSVVIDEAVSAGDYLISVTCTSEGQKYILKNALTVTVISGMPEQIVVSPSTLNVRYEDLMTTSSAETATASVVTVGESAEITGYEIRNIRTRTVNGNQIYDEPLFDGVEDAPELFTVSDEGIISLVKGDDWELATYVMDIKVNTESYGSDSEEGLLADALTVNVAAEVITVTYPESPEYLAPNLTKIYIATIDGPVEGGPRVENFTITGVTLDGVGFTGFEDIFSIDPDSGDITAGAPEDIESGIYAISISYEYAGQSLLSTGALTISCLPGVPSTIAVEPSSISIEQPDIVSGGASYSFSIVTEGESAEITGYAIHDFKYNGTSTSYSPYLSINESTGVLTLITGQQWATGTYTVDVKVNTVSFGADTDQGVAVDALTINIVAEMIFNYDDARSSQKYATGWSVSPETTLNNAVYSWTEPGAAYTEYLSLDSSNGNISAVKGNGLAEGSYEVKVTATVSGSQSVSAVYNLTVTDNPYYFTYFSYGNNLDLTEEQTKGVSLFRAQNRTSMPNIEAVIKYTDLSDEGKSHTTWSWESKYRLENTEINSSTGELTFGSTSGEDWQNYRCGILVVTAVSTDPDDSENTWTVEKPVFVHFRSASSSESVIIEYSPFVLRVNPNSTEAVRGAVPVLTGVDDEDLFFLDYRRNFYYYDLEDSSRDNTESTISDSSFIADLWTSYGAGLGSKDPVSYFSNIDNLDAALAYVDNAASDNKLSVVVNPQKWINSSGEPANGVLMGQMTFVTDGDTSSINNGDSLFPFIIWLDPTYNE